MTSNKKFKQEKEGTSEERTNNECTLSQVQQNLEKRHGRKNEKQQMSIVTSLNQPRERQKVVRRNKQ